MNNWHNIWSKKSVSLETGSVLAKLLLADGFDSAAGKINFSADEWQENVKYFYKRMEASPEDSFFEVGCGSGAFLYPVLLEGNTVGGIDFSVSLIDLARQAMPEMSFNVNSADNLPVEPQYDFVTSYSVFHYFENLDYSKKVIEKMFSKACKGIAILDLPDLEKKDISEGLRRNTLSEGEYEKKYQGLEHLYYSKDWFYDLGKQLNCDTDIFEKSLEGLKNSGIRFNVIFKKR